MTGHIFLGQFDEALAGHPKEYYAERYTFLDFRGGLKIAPTAQFGLQNMVITLSHHIENGQFEIPVVNRPVTIDDYAWITSRCVLYNCHIGHHAIVAIGAVVSNVEVPPYTIVAGNPARQVAVWNGKSWRKIEVYDTGDDRRRS